jgi:hypothetical protein
MIYIISKFGMSIFSQENNMCHMYGQKRVSTIIGSYYCLPGSFMKTDVPVCQCCP